MTELLEQYNKKFLKFCSCFFVLTIISYLFNIDKKGRNLLVLSIKMCLNSLENFKVLNLDGKFFKTEDILEF